MHTAPLSTYSRLAAEDAGFYELQFLPHINNHHEKIIDLRLFSKYLAEKIH